MSNNGNQLAKYDGIGGWLILLCFALVIGSPLRTIYNIYTGYTGTHLYFDQYPGLIVIFTIDLIGSLFLMALAIRAGIALYNVKKSAVRIAKKFLLISLGYAMISAFLPFMAGLPLEVNEAMIPEVVKAAVLSLGSFAIWFSYLSLSKRVHATYRDYSFEETTSKPVLDQVYTESNEKSELAVELTHIIERQLNPIKTHISDIPSEFPANLEDNTGRTWVIDGKTFTIYKKANGINFIPFDDGQDGTEIIKEYVDFDHFEILPVFIEEPIPNLPDFVKVKATNRLVGINIVPKSISV